MLSKETHDTVVRFAPPLTIARADLDFALERIEETVRELETAKRRRGVRADPTSDGAASLPVIASESKAIQTGWIASSLRSSQ